MATLQCYVNPWAYQPFAVLSNTPLQVTVCSWLLQLAQCSAECVCTLQGQVLNQTSAWWMHATQHIAHNALLAVPDPNVSIMRRCRVFPVEFVVRGYLTGMPRCKTLGSSAAESCMQGSESPCNSHLPACMRLASGHGCSVPRLPCSTASHAVPQAAQTLHCGRTMLRAHATIAATASRTACARMTGAPA